MVLVTSKPPAALTVIAIFGKSAPVRLTQSSTLSQCVIADSWPVVLMVLVAEVRWIGPLSSVRSRPISFTHRPGWPAGGSAQGRASRPQGGSRRVAVNLRHDHARLRHHHIAIAGCAVTASAVGRELHYRAVGVGGDQLLGVDGHDLGVRGVSAADGVDHHAVAPAAQGRAVGRCRLQQHRCWHAGGGARRAWPSAHSTHSAPWRIRCPPRCHGRPTAARSAGCRWPSRPPQRP